MPTPVAPLLGFLFGTPLAALAAAAGVVAIPIIIHLLNRRRFRVVTWAAMRFLLNAERKNSRRMRLEQIILLAVRCLIVALLVLALASVMPWAEKVWASIFPTSFASGGPNTQRTHKILVIDGSFSMAMKPDDESYFERARALANQIVEESPRGDGFSVVLMTAPARRIVSEASEDAAKVGAEIQNLKLPHGNADLGSALTVIEDLLRHSPDKFVEKEVYFLTDLQRSTWIDRRVAGSGESLERFQTARKIFIDVGRDGQSNTAVTNLSLGVSLPTTKTKTPISATIQHYGPDKRGKVHVQLWIGKAQEKAGDKPLEMTFAAEEERDLGQGPITVSFQYQFTAPGDYVVQVRVDADKLDLDDVRSAVVRVKDNVPVLLVNGKEATDPFDTATEYLKTYLDPSEDANGPVSLFAKPKMIPYSEFGDGASVDLSKYDCVFLCDVPSFRLSEIRRLETHLRAGGGVVISLGRNIDPGAYNELLYRGGKGMLPGRLTAKQQSPRDCFFHFAPDNKAKLDPPLDAFTSDRSRLKLLEPEFYTYYRVEPDTQARKILTFMPHSFLARTSPAAAEEVKKLPSGDPALLEWQPPIALAPSEDGQRPPGRSRGRVVLITSTVNEDWNNWCKKDDCFLTLIDDLTRYAVAGRLREHAVIVGDPLEEYLQSTAKRQEAEIRLPDGRKESVRAQSFEDGSVVRWSDTDLSGLYVATIGQNPQEMVFAVNVPTATETLEASESDPTRATPENLRSTYSDWDFQLLTDPHDVNHATGASGAEQEPSRLPIGPFVARVLLLAMFTLFMLQVVLAWCFGHYSGVADSAGRHLKRAGPRGLAATLLNVLPYGMALGLFAAIAAIGLVLIHYAWTGDFLGFLPDGLRLFAESLFGIPAPAAGEGSRWRLEFFPFLWSANADPWLAAALAMGAIALIGVVYSLEGIMARVRPLALLVLGGLCACFVLLALVILLPQVQLSFERQAWPDVVILVDDSQSMSTVDGYQDPRVQEVADSLAERLPKDGSELSEAHRLGLARALVARGDSDWLTTLLSKRKFKLHIYHCSTKAARIADVSESDQLPDAKAVLDGLKPDPAHDSSQLGAAVRQVLNDFRGSSLAAIVMLSDGVTTEGEDLVKVSKYAGQTGVPLYLVGLGDNQKPRDLILHDLQVEDTVYVNDRVVFEVRLTGNGYADLSVPVRLREKGNQKVLAEQTVKVEAGGRAIKVKLVHQPTEKGEKTFVIDVPVQEGEASPDNNRVERTIFVQDTKLIKVLYVEGYPRYEFRFIKNLLERESALTKGNKSIDLKVLLLNADSEWAGQDKSAFEDRPGGVRISREGFLAKDELFKFDVIIWGDVDPKGKDYPQDYPKMQDYLKSVAEFVEKKGGGFLMIAGPRFAPHAYKDSPLKDILPIDIGREPPPAEPADGRDKGFRPELTSVGRHHPIFRFSSEEQDNDEIWNRLKEMRWHSQGYKPKRAAEVLAIFPGPKTKPDPANEDRPRRDDEDRALVVQQFLGAGRCLFFGFEETWLWQFREDLVHFNQFWIQTVRYLARSRQGRIEIRLDRQTPYRRGEPIKVSVHFPDDAPPPDPDVAVKVTVERHPPKNAPLGETEVQTLTLAKLDGSRATFEGLLTNTPEGEYRFWLREPVVIGEKPRAECRVLAPPTEMENVQMNKSDMEEAAQQSHGRFYTLAEADRLPAELPSGTRVTINAPGPPLLVWNHVLVFLLAILLITTEWILRKRANLL